MSIKSISIGGRTDIKKVTIDGGVLFEKISETYTPITPSDTDAFPETLNGFYAEPFVGLASGKSTSYVGSVYAKPWLTQGAKKLGRIYSSWGNGVSSFEEYHYGSLAIGYSSDSETRQNRALNVWISETRITVDAANPLIDALNTTILYELFESDGSVWVSAKRDSDGVLGYWNEATGKFVPTYGMEERQEPPVDLPYLCFTAEEANSTVGTAITGTVSPLPVLEYSTDGTTWSNFVLGSSGTVVTLANVGDKVYLRGDNSSFSTGSSKYIKFVMSGKIAASGNVMSLLDKTCESVTIPNNYCYRYMFSGCTSLTIAPELPATTLANYCYNYMFNGCTSLTIAPELPATTLANDCYRSMFASCTSLTIAPELPATTLASYCYENMFSGCTSLYVSDTSGAGHDKAWNIPTTGTASGNYIMSSMFYQCLGTRSTDAPNFNGVQKTYYTQNVPV